VVVEVAIAVRMPFEHVPVGPQIRAVIDGAGVGVVVAVVAEVEGGADQAAPGDERDGPGPEAAPTAQELHEPEPGSSCRATSTTPAAPHGACAPLDRAGRRRDLQDPYR